MILKSVITDNIIAVIDYSVARFSITEYKLKDWRFQFCNTIFNPGQSHLLSLYNLRGSSDRRMPPSPGIPYFNKEFQIQGLKILLKRLKIHDCTCGSNIVIAGVMTSSTVFVGTLKCFRTTC